MTRGQKFQTLVLSSTKRLAGVILPGIDRPVSRPNVFLGAAVPVILENTLQRALVPRALVQRALVQRALVQRALVPCALMLCVLTVTLGCGRPVSALCSTTAECDAGSTCAAGACIVGGASGCTTDLDCDPASAQLCQYGICVAGAGTPETTNADCVATVDCPTTQFCNSSSGVCVALLEGWCRLDSQCSGETLACSNKLQGGQDFPGRCVQCNEAADCGGAACVSPGICEAEALGCPPNSSAVAGGGCRCDPAFSDDGAGNCIVNPVVGAGAGEGEGEGEGEGAGEGEGNPVQGSDSCTTEGECYERHDYNWTCDSAVGACTCDELWLEVICDAGYDLAACACGNNGGSGGGGGTSTANQECFSDSDCGDLLCIFSGAADLFDPGYCKVACTTNSECSAGLTCMDNALADGSGFCATVVNAGGSCQSSIYQVDFSSDVLCDGGATAILDCFSNRCETVCDWPNKSGPPEICDSGTCGALVFRAEAGSAVGVCN